LPTHFSTKVSEFYNKNNNNTNNNNSDTQDHIYSAIIYGAKPYARVHFGWSSVWSLSARWLPTRRPSCKLDLLVRL